MNPAHAHDHSRGCVVWQSQDARPVAARVAVAGDLLPAGKLTLLQSASPWREMAGDLTSLFEDADVSFVNLECALDAEGLPPRQLAGLGDIVSARSAALDYLEAIHSRVVGIANNHSYDFGVAGVERTRHALMARGMAPLGIENSTHCPADIFVWRSKEGEGGIRVGFWAAALACADLATQWSPGVAPATVSLAKRAIAALRAQGAQFSIALLHAGCLRTNRPDPGDADRINSIAAEGFDVVAASHSHRIAGATMSANREGCPRFCFYGLGSIVSGFVASPLEREGLVVLAALDASGALVSLEVRPLLLAASGFGAAPSAGAASVILDRFRALSREIEDGSSARLFYQDVSRGLLHLYARDVQAAFTSAGLRGLAAKAGRLRLRHIRRLVHRVAHAPK